MGENMDKDNVFKKKMKEVPPFTFNEEVTRVFDDMLNRSVPLYRQGIKMTAKLARTLYQEGTCVYDLGCSHGNLGITLLDIFEDIPFKMIGIDSSEPMIDKYLQRLKQRQIPGDVQLFCDRIENIGIDNASVVVINLTLQFLEPSVRDRVITRVFEGLNPGGVLLLTEKIVHQDLGYTDFQNEFYQSFKLENGYSRLEISQKRDALEKVLIPETVEAHEKRIRNAGFVFFDIWLKWFNFASMIAFKQDG
ncbi:MAG: carboxy-S-adenosyl-L-methionine synthase CmoA [Desulfobacteraceae bacterium]|nr:MAG: carboxy-S-adenosyl-L-methionine synthase CmoA [Desulfobacteraceae bacterium]